MADSQIHALDKSRVQSPREAHSLYSGFESGLRSKAHHWRDLYQPPPSVAFLHLTVDQIRRNPPSKDFAPTTPYFSPLTKVSRESIEVAIEAITGEEREATRGQALSQRVDKHMHHVWRKRTEMKHWNNFGEGIDGQPEPENLCGAAQPGSQFVQLQVRKVQVAEAALMEDFSVPASASEP
jgi:hypothetical protein